MKLNRITVVLALAFLFPSCGEKGYAPGDESNYLGVNVYFTETEPYQSLPLDEHELTFYLERDDAPREDENVPLKFSCAFPEAFDVPEYAFFPRGEMKSEVTVYFTDRMEDFKEYRLSLYVDENYTQQYMEQSDYPRIDVTVIKEDYEPAYRCRYTCGGVYLGLISWSNPQVMVDLEYSEILDAYRVDLWGHGTYVNFSVDEDDNLVLDKTTFNTGEEYVNGDETFEVMATVSGDCTWNSRTRMYTFPFNYSFGGNSAGEYDDQLQVSSEL